MVGITAATITVFISAVVGAFLRLLLYPQFLFGGGLILASMLIKLSRNLMGVLLVIGISLAVLTLLVVFNARIFKGVKRVSPAIGRLLVRAAEILTKQFYSAAESTTKQLPPWTPTLLTVLIPFIGQLAGSLSTMRMLSKVEVKSPMKDVPGLVYSSTFSLAYLCAQAFVIKPNWLKPQKVSFFMQTFWVVAALVSPKSARNIEFRENLPSVLAGWGGFILSFLPPGAVMTAFQAGVVSGAVTAGAALTVTGVGETAKLLRGDYNMGLSMDEVGEQVKKLTVSWDDVKVTWAYYMSEEALHDRINKLSSYFSKNMLNDAWISFQETLTFKKRPLGEQVGDQHVDEVDFPGVQNEDIQESIDDRDKGASNEGENIEDTKENETSMLAKLEEAGLNIQSLAPPVPVAVLLVVLKMIPTCLVLCFGIVNFVFSIIFGNFKPGLLLFPFMLAPFAFSELINLVKFLGLGKRGLTPGSVLNSFFEEYDDGMSLLLHDSPKALNIWQKIAYLNNAVQDVNKEELVGTLVQAPKQYFNPDEETIRNAPEFSRWIAAKLIVSLLIDVIGVLSIGIPIVGDVLDLAWAPVSGYIIHSLYGVTMISWLGVVEELLPFTDILPTATIAWIYTYGQHLPAWTIRFSREMQLDAFTNPLEGQRLNKLKLF